MTIGGFIQPDAVLNPEKLHSRARVARTANMTSSVHSDEAAAIPVVRANLVNDIVEPEADH